MTTDAVHAELVSLYAGSTPVRSRWSYRADQPFTVVAAFQTDRNRWVEWVFSRDLLADGLLAEAGEGDVRIRPATDDPETVIFELSSPSGHAVFETSAHRLADFLDRTYDIVVPGGEALWLDFDDAVEHLLSNDLHG